jgi:hypothetical protein
MFFLGAMRKPSRRFPFPWLSGEKGRAWLSYYLEVDEGQARGWDDHL